MRVVAVLQARMNSSRLPGKVMLPLAGRPMVQNIIERVMRATKLDEVVLAYPLLDHQSFFPMTRTGCSMYAYPGDENDLIERYLGAATAYNADIIVRIPCDNPCVDPEYIDRAIDEYRTDPYVFYSNTTDFVKTPHPNTPWMAVDGVGCEVFSVSRLRWLDNKTVGNAERREHPHRYFQDFLRESDMNYGAISGTMKAALRLDVNTQSDYEFIKYIYDHFGHNRFTAAEVLAYLDSKQVSA